MSLYGDLDDGTDAQESMSLLGDLDGGADALSLWGDLLERTGVQGVWERLEGVQDLQHSLLMYERKVFLTSFRRAQNSRKRTNPWKELQKQKIEENTNFESPMAKKPKTHVRPISTVMANAFCNLLIVCCFDLDRSGAFPPTLVVHRRYNTLQNTARLNSKIVAFGKTTPKNNGCLVPTKQLKV